MHEGRLVFAQLMDFFPEREFNECVARYQGNYRLRGFTCRGQFLAMAFAQLTFRDSLRDVVTCLRAMNTKLYHAGFRGSISRSTLADANERRDWRIYHDFAQILIRRARQLYLNEPLAVGLQQTVYALDSTIIELCLSLFPWAHSQRKKAAIKVHTLLDLRGNIPCFVRITRTKVADSALLDQLVPEPGSYYVLDRGYHDFARLHRWSQAGAFFVVRGRRNITFDRQSSHAVDRTTGLRSDQQVRFRDRRTAKGYPERLRRVTFYYAQRRQRLILLTNAFTIPALTVSTLYRSRWQIELFFKWIKQHLRIKHFLGLSPNAVKTQIWIAISTYLLVAILKRQLRVERSLSEILQIFSVTLFEKTPDFTTLLNQNAHFPKTTCPNQLPLFDF
ncbi:MAG: IS4 family transposase [Planctomycetia bacterium]|nr:IS4 family transposase [Planctomycetia bacterium]